MAASGGGPRGAGESGAEVGPVIRPSGARRPARKFTRANHFNGLPALLRNFLRPWFCFADPAPSPVLIWPKTFRAGIGVTEFALSIFLPKGPQPTTCHLRAHFEFFQWLAAPFPSHSQLPTRLLQTRRFDQDRRPAVMFRFLPAPSQNEALISPDETKRFAGVIVSHWNRYGLRIRDFAALFVFNDLSPFSFRRFRMVILFKDLVPLRFRLAVGPSWSFGRVMWRAGWAVTSHSPVLTPKSQLARRHDKCEPGLSTFLKNIISSTSRLGKKLSIFLIGASPNWIEQTVTVFPL